MGLFWLSLTQTGGIMKQCRHIIENRHTIDFGNHEAVIQGFTFNWCGGCGAIRKSPRHSWINPKRNTQAVLRRLK